MSACASCKGAGKTVGYACPGFRRIEWPCEPCGGTGTAPPWQAETIAAGQRLRAKREEADLSLFEAAAAWCVPVAHLSRAEIGNMPLAEWPAALRMLAGPAA